MAPSLYLGAAFEEGFVSSVLDRTNSLPMGVLLGRTKLRRLKNGKRKL